MLFYCQPSMKPWPGVMSSHQTLIEAQTCRAPPPCRSLSLASNNLTAANWTVLTSLTTLSYLDLHGNRLLGTVPSSIGQLSALTTCLALSQRR